MTDALSGPAGFTLKAVTSNEADNGLGDGDTVGDIQGFTLGGPDTTGQLRAERAGQGTGRTYTLLYEGKDVAGNTASCSAIVTVPARSRAEKPGRSGRWSPASATAAQWWSAAQRWSLAQWWSVARRHAHRAIGVRRDRPYSVR